jgi:adenylate cyclase
MNNFMAGLIKKFMRASGVRGLLVLTGFCFTLAMAVLFVFQPFFLRLIDLKVYDTMFRSTYSDQISEDVVIVDLDEESLAEFGQWPWPRYRVALLLEKIRRAGPLSIGLDMVFAEEDRTSPRIIRGQLEKELGVFIDFTGLPVGLEDNDAILAGILEKGPFALGYYFDPETSASGFAGNMSDSATLDSLQMAVLGGKNAQPLDRALFKASRIINNIPVLSAAASGSGFMNVAPDSDGIIRRVPLIMHYNGDVYPSLALSVMLNALDSKQTLIRTNSHGVESLLLGGLTIPLDSRGQMLLNYRGPSRTVKYISAGDILQDALEPGLLSGKIVFLGTSSAGLKDIRTTPIDSVYPGVEAQATVVDNILSRDFLFRPAWAPGTGTASGLHDGADRHIFHSSAWKIMGYCSTGALWSGDLVRRPSPSGK